MSIISIDKFPTDPIERENLVILSQEDFNKAMATYEDGQFLLDEHICYMVQPINEEAKTHPIIKNIYQNQQLKSGAILLQDYIDNDRYLPYESLLNKSIEAQLSTFVQLCQSLGAKRVIWAYSEQENESSHTKAEVSGRYGLGEGSTGFMKGKTDEIAKRIDAETEFEGGVLDFTQATQLMQTGIFNENEQIKSFYNTARNQKNKMTRQKVTFKVAENLSKKLKVFAKLEGASIFKNAIGGEANFEKIKDASRVIEVTYEVIF